MTTLFENVLYLDGASGATTKRTPSTRGVDVINVKSFGATGDGITDDTTAINNAVKSATSNWANGLCGEIFFPPGTYIITSPILIDVFQGLHSVIIRGVGQASAISGNFAGFAIKASNNATGGIVLIENLSISNNHAQGGAIELFGTVSCCVANCSIGAGLVGIHNEQGASCSVRECQIVCGIANWPAGSVGVLTRGDDSLSMVDITSWGTGVRFHGGGHTLVGGRFERNVTGVELGRSQSCFTGSLTGTTLTVSTLITQQPVGPPCALAAGATVYWNSGSSSGVIASQTSGTTGGVGVYALTGTGTSTSTSMFCLGDDQCSDAFIGGFTMEANGTGIYAFDAGNTSIMNISVQADVSSPRAENSTATGANYGIRLNNFGGLMHGCSVAGSDSSSFQVAGISVGNAGGSEIVNCAATTGASSPGSSWTLNSDRRFLPTFRGCTNPTVASASASGPSVAYQFQRMIFTDASTTAYGTILTGGGANHVFATYDGTNWRIDGIAT